MNFNITGISDAFSEIRSGGEYPGKSINPMRQKDLIDEECPSQKLTFPLRKKDWLRIYQDIIESIIKNL